MPVDSEVVKPDVTMASENVDPTPSGLMSEQTGKPDITTSADSEQRIIGKAEEEKIGQMDEDRATTDESVKDGTKSTAAIIIKEFQPQVEIDEVIIVEDPEDIYVAVITETMDSVPPQRDEETMEGSDDVKTEPEAEKVESTDGQLSDVLELAPEVEEVSVTVVDEMVIVSDDGDTVHIQYDQVTIVQSVDDLSSEKMYMEKSTEDDDASTDGEPMDTEPTVVQITANKSSESSVSELIRQEGKSGSSLEECEPETEKSMSLLTGKDTEEEGSESIMEQDVTVSKPISEKVISKKHVSISTQPTVDSNADDGDKYHTVDASRTTIKQNEKELTERIDEVPMKTMESDKEETSSIPGEIDDAVKEEKPTRAIIETANVDEKAVEEVATEGESLIESTEVTMIVTSLALDGKEETLEPTNKFVIVDSIAEVHVIERESDNISPIEAHGSLEVTGGNVQIESPIVTVVSIPIAIIEEPTNLERKEKRRKSVDEEQINVEREEKRIKPLEVESNIPDSGAQASECIPTESVARRAEIVSSHLEDSANTNLVRATRDEINDVGPIDPNIKMEVNPMEMWEAIISIRNEINTIKKHINHINKHLSSYTPYNEGDVSRAFIDKNVQTEISQVDTKYIAADIVIRVTDIDAEPEDVPQVDSVDRENEDDETGADPQNRDEIVIHEADISSSKTAEDETIDAKGKQNIELHSGITDLNISTMVKEELKDSEVEDEKCLSKEDEMDSHVQPITNETLSCPSDQIERTSGMDHHIVQTTTEAALEQTETSVEVEVVEKTEGHIESGIIHMPVDSSVAPVEASDVKDVTSNTSTEGNTIEKMKDEYPSGETITVTEIETIPEEKITTKPIEEKKDRFENAICQVTDANSTDVHENVTCILSTDDIHPNSIKCDAEVVSDKDVIDSDKNVIEGETTKVIESESNAISTSQTESMQAAMPKREDSVREDKISKLLPEVANTGDSSSRSMESIGPAEKDSPKDEEESIKTQEQLSDTINEASTPREDIPDVEQEHSKDYEDYVVKEGLPEENIIYERQNAVSVDEILMKDFKNLESTFEDQEVSTDHSSQNDMWVGLQQDYEKQPQCECKCDSEFIHKHEEISSEEIMGNSRMDEKTKNDGPGIERSEEMTTEDSIDTPIEVNETLYNAGGIDKMLFEDLMDDESFLKELEELYTLLSRDGDININPSNVENETDAMLHESAHKTEPTSSRDDSNLKASTWSSIPRDNSSQNRNIMENMANKDSTKNITVHESATTEKPIESNSMKNVHMFFGTFSQLSDAPSTMDFNRMEQEYEKFKQFQAFMQLSTKDQQ
eukprot:XP_001609960.1 hypothetical protein [Babesia bovis T2Bo]